MKKFFLLIALLAVLGFSTQAQAGVSVVFGVGGPGAYYGPGYYGGYYPAYYPPPYGYSYVGPSVYVGPGYYPWYHGYWRGGYCYRGYGHGGGYHHH